MSVRFGVFSAGASLVAHFVGMLLIGRVCRSITLSPPVPTTRLISNRIGDCWFNLFLKKSERSLFSSLIGCPRLFSNTPLMSSIWIRNWNWWTKISPYRFLINLIYVATLSYLNNSVVVFDHVTATKVRFLGLSFAPNRHARGSDS